MSTGMGADHWGHREGHWLASTVCTVLSVAEINTITKSNLGGKGFSDYSLQFTVYDERSWGKNSRPELMRRLWGNPARSL